MQNILDPAILFFVFGVLAGAVRSNLEIPPAISRFLSLYLLMALGLKGGFALSHSGLTASVGLSLAAAVALAIAVPLIGYNILRRFVSGFDAAAVAATYGSVSAVTFVTAVQYLENQQVAYGGHMAAAMALMESPAIIMAIVFANSLRQQASATATVSAVMPPGGAAVLSGPGATLAAGAGSATGGKHGVSVGKILHESFTDGAQLLLLGAMVVGIVTGDAGKAAMQPFSGDLFKGMLSFFLLDMGLMAARNLMQIRGKSPVLVAYAVLGPLLHATLALTLAVLLHLPTGDAALLMVLAASASYIAVPAVLRYAMPEATPSLYFGLSLGVTFPLNILFGIPLYVAVARAVLG
ncbi:sodium-dependent bicarbonate transport family permease [Duganella fentianensis]|uniref:sodium-dependent bicarbonate transport family permease n=1 Tax=Duganella fentianensis TaxID=2692177 RepID=UPI0032B2844A